MTTPRYVRFAQALTLAVVPACSGVSPEPSSKVDPPSAEAVPHAAPSKVIVAPPIAPSVDPTSEPSAQKYGATPAPQVVVAVADAGGTPVADEASTDAGEDAAAPAYPHSSGPIVPPELPAGFAC
jgi:hypothetical protein